MSESARPAVGAKAAWRAYLQQCAADARQTPDLRVGIAASFTADALAQFAGAHLLANGLRPEIRVGPYNQILQVCRGAEAHFGGPVDVIVLLWRIEDVMLEEAVAFLGGDAAAFTRAKEKLASLRDAIAGLRSRFAGTVIAGTPPFPSSAPVGLLDLHNQSGLGAFHRGMVSAFVDQLASIESVRIVDLDAVQRELGLRRSFDERQWYLYRQPFSDDFLHETGKQIGRIVVAGRRAPRKCVVLDCDNTLWGGIVGEDGIEGIQIGEEFPGSVYRDFQKLLLHWRNQGVLLAVASKNNEDDVWEVFEKHDGMVLRREHLSAVQINWQPKSKNIPLIAKALNIGIDSLVFVDDSAMEIAQVRDALPDLVCIQVPEEPADFLSTMQTLTCFDSLEITEEDRKRADMMRAEASREVLGSQLGKKDFLETLELRFQFSQVKAEELSRVTQLINKTNQFNLTTVRRTLDETRQLMESGAYRVYALRVSDRFGEYGLTGVVIVKISADRKSWAIDTLVMSCRVLGRGVETALLAELAADARASGAVQLFASFIPTKKNAPAAKFLPEHGFVHAEGSTWQIRLDAIPARPPYLQRVEQLDASSKLAA